jgi:hypothetical protein
LWSDTVKEQRKRFEFQQTGKVSKQLSVFLISSPCIDFYRLELISYSLSQIERMNEKQGRDRRQLNVLHLKRSTDFRKIGDMACYYNCRVSLIRIYIGPQQRYLWPV